MKYHSKAEGKQSRLWIADYRIRIPDWRLVKWGGSRGQHQIGSQYSQHPWIPVL